MIKVFNTDASYWHQEGYDLNSIYKHVARCSRVCYQSSAKDGEMPYEFLKRVILRGKDIHDINKEDIDKLHLSVFEHGTVHLRIPINIVVVNDEAKALLNNNFSRFTLINEEGHNYYYITTNMRVIIEGDYWSCEQFVDNDKSRVGNYPKRSTICITTDIGCSRELNRHRCHSVSEESTRYCVSGDTKLKFKNPHLHYTIKELYDNFYNLQKSQIEYLDENTGELKFINPNKIFNNGLKEVYEFKTKLGYSLKCTKDHRIYTPNGYIELNNLSIGDKVYINGNNIDVLYKDETWLKYQYIILNKTVSQISKEFKFRDCTIRKWLHKFNITKPVETNQLYKDKDWLYNQNITLNKTFVDIAKEFNYNVSTLKNWARIHNIPSKGTGYFNKGHIPWNKGLSEDDDDRVKNQVNALRKFHYDKSKKGIKILKNDTSKYQKHNKNVCEICGSTKDVEIHHIDKNHNNNSPENLMSICSSCHTRIHHNNINVLYADEIVSINKIGIEEVYDIEMPKDHNYVANGIIVHNCRYTANKFGNNISILKLPWIDYSLDPNDITQIGYENGFYNDKEIFNEKTNFIEPMNTNTWNAIDWFLYGIQIANLVYAKCIEKGWKAQQAREILPLNTKTQLVHTAFDTDWQHFINLRRNEVSGAVHPVMKDLAERIYSCLNKW